MAQSNNPTLLILGNGFDLAAGMQSSFKHYMAYLEGTNQDLFGWMGKMLEDYCVNSPHATNHQHPVNIWKLIFCVMYFVAEKTANLPLPKRKLELWNDVEGFMLTLFSDEDGSWARIIPRCADDYRETTLPLTRLLAFYISESGELSSVIGNGAITPELVSFLLKELKDFEKEFGQYIAAQERRIGVLETKQKIIGKLTDEEYIIDTFNYGEDSLRQVRHINGNIESPIFGVDATELGANSPWLPFSKTSRRLYRSFIRGTDSFQAAPDKAVIYGHSLTPRDYSYFYGIFDLMKIYDPTARSILTFAYSAYDGCPKLQASQDCAAKVINLLNGYEQYRTPGIKSELGLLTRLQVADRIKTLYVDLGQQSNGFGDVWQDD